MEKTNSAGPATSEVEHPQTPSPRRPHAAPVLLPIPTAVDNDTGHSTIRIQRILVPVDFSETSRQALVVASSWAKALGADLHILHVGGIGSPGYEDAVGEFPKMQSAIESKVRDEWIAVGGSADLPAGSLTIHVRLGWPYGKGQAAWQEIVEVATVISADMVILGTHGHTGLKHVWLGSTAERVVRHASCWVQTVPPAASTSTTTISQPAMPVRSILVPLDLSRESEAAMAPAIALALKFQAQVVFAHVLEPGIYSPHALASVYDPETEEVVRQQLVQRTLPSVAGGVMASTLLIHGNPGLEIAAAAARLETDLIVMTTHGYTGWRHVLIGSTAERVLRHARCPVLVIRGMGGQEPSR